MKKNTKPTIKVLIAYHKKSKVYCDDILTPINVGRALQDKKSETYKWLTENMIGDDTGDNISNKNSSYNELTALYWAWKNYDKLDNPDYLGFMHYRRFFDYTQNAKTPNSICEDSNCDLIKESHYSKNVLTKLLTSHDFICSYPFYRDTVYTHYKENHIISDLDLAYEILCQKYPDYKSSAEKYLHGDKAYFFNMFIFPKKIFLDYCEWIFSILFEFEKHIDITNKRLFISERLTGIYIQHLLDNNLNAKLLPTIYMEGQHNIPIIFSTDENYALQTCVTMCSIMENAKKNSFINFHILVPSIFSDETKNKFNCILDKYPNCNINFTDMKNSFESAKLQNCHITLPTYYRLLAPRLFPQYNKMIYLDSDIIVKKDLTAMFDTSLDDYLVAGVKAPAYHLYDDATRQKYCKRTGFASLDQYINAGAIVMNLQKMRDLDSVGKFIFYSQNNNPSQDQDVLNFVCYNKIKLLPLRFNNMLSKYQKNGEILENVFSAQDISEADKNPIIIHYCDKIKPWNNKQCYKSNEWWHYAKIINLDSYFEKQLYFNNLNIPAINKTFKPSISVIIPVYNMELYLKQCLESVITQTLKDIEIICINDGSTDNSLHIVNEYAKYDKRIMVINQRNIGVGPSRNIGILNSSGNYIAFMDPDDYYPSNNVLENLYKKGKANSALIIGGSFCEDHNGVIKSNFRADLQAYIFKEEGFINYSDHQFDFGYIRFIYDSKLIKSNNVRFPSYIRFQDPPFFVRAMILAKKFYAIPMFAYCYRWGHKTIDWNSQRINDLLRGIRDNTLMSAKANLSKLHAICYKRINVDNYANIVKILQSGDWTTVSILLEINNYFNSKLLEKEGISVKNNIFIEPIKAIISFKNSNYDLFTEQLKIEKDNSTKLINELNHAKSDLTYIRNSASFKIGRIITFIPRKIRSLLKRKK